MHNAQCTKHNCFRYSFFKQRKQGENKGETKNNQSKKTTNQKTKITNKKGKEPIEKTTDFSD